MEKKFTTGGALMDMGIDAADLMGLVRAGDIDGPISVTGAKRTSKTDPCLFCYPIRPGSGFLSRHGVKPCDHVQTILCDKATESELRERVSKALFPLQSLNQLQDVLGLTPLKMDGDREKGKKLLPLHPQRKETPKEFADRYRSNEGVKACWIMLELVQRYGLKKYEAAALALGDPVPEKGTPEAKSYGCRYRYHVEQLDQNE